MGKIPEMQNSCPNTRTNGEKKLVGVDASLGKNECVKKGNSGKG